MRVRMTIRGEQSLKGLTPVYLRQVIRETLSRAFPQVFDTHRTVTLDVACVSDTEILKLNQSYRKKSQPTDILSFGMFETREAVRTIPKPDLIELGQLVLSPSFIVRSAKEDGVSWKREFTYVFSHGVLHLVGFDHEEKMFEIQDVVTDILAPLSQEKKKHAKK